MVLTLLGLLTGCWSSASVDGACDELCDELFNECQYDAYPSLPSCLQGCEYAASEGADVDAQRACIVNAGCDTFEILECEHTYGESSAF
jgi:hypothetical protein